MILSVASGKGGTGKTTVAVGMALSLENVQLLDCDVEEPNVHILLHPEINETRAVNVPVPVVDEKLCDYCGKCSEFCEYNAIVVMPNKVMTFPALCHGCGGCSIICPKSAITEEKREIGLVKKGFAGNIEFACGELKIGEPMADPIIKQVKSEINDKKTVIIDAPPGTSCPVITSVYGSDCCLLVTEPTPFGLHDLKLTIEMLREIKIPFGVIVNRAGIGDRKVYGYCEEEGIPILLEIPFSRRVAELYSRGIPFVNEMPEWKREFLSIFNSVEKQVGK